MEWALFFVAAVVAEYVHPNVMADFLCRMNCEVLVRASKNHSISQTEYLDIAGEIITVLIDNYLLVEAKKKHGMLHAIKAAQGEAHALRNSVIEDIMGHKCGSLHHEIVASVDSVAHSHLNKREFEERVGLVPRLGVDE